MAPSLVLAVGIDRATCRASAANVQNHRHVSSCSTNWHWPSPRDSQSPPRLPASHQAKCPTLWHRGATYLGRLLVQAVMPCKPSFQSICETLIRISRRPITTRWGPHQSLVANAGRLPRRQTGVLERTDDACARSRRAVGLALRTAAQTGLAGREVKQPGSCQLRLRHDSAADSLALSALRAADGAWKQPPRTQRGRVPIRES